jgi:chromate reductase
MKILGVSGSLRAASFNTALLRAAQALAPDGVTIEIFGLHDLPLFNQDVEDQGDPAARRRLEDRHPRRPTPCCWPARNIMAASPAS